MHNALFRLAATALALVLSSGCLTPVFGPQPLAGKPGSATFADCPLRDGDVVVTRALGPTSMLLARHGPTPGEFSHAGVFVYGPDGTPMVYHLRDGGSRTMKAKTYLRLHELVGVYRHRRPDAAEVLGPYIREWVATHSVRTVPFTLFPNPEDFNSPPYNCNTFVNSFYLGAGLDAPFVRPPPAPPTPWTEDLSRFFGNDWTRITSAGAVAGNPAFMEVLVWRNPTIDPRLTAGLKGFTDLVRAEVEDGRHVSPQARRRLAQCIADCCGQPDDEYATPQAMAIQFNLQDAWVQVRNRLLRLMRREGDAFTEADAYELARKLALVHLDGFFE